MKPKTTIILLVIVGVCIALALLSGDLFGPGKPKDTHAEKQDLFKGAPGAPVQVTLTGKTGTFAFRKDGDDWRITEPIDAKAVTWRVDDVADSLKGLQGLPAEDAADDLTGLGSPLWTITVVYDKQGKAATRSLLVGRPRPLHSDQTYVRPAGGKQTFVVETDFADKLDKSLSDFRDETVLDLTSADVVRLTVTGEKNYELVKRGEDWALVQPAAAASTDEVQKVLDKACRVTASEFVADEPADLANYGLAQPRLRVEIEMKSDEPTTLPATTQPVAKKPGKTYGFLLGRQAQDKIYAKLLNQPAVFKVDASLLDDLKPEVVDLRVKTVLKLAADDVSGIEISMPAGKALLTKADGQWRMTAPLKGKADAGAVRDLLDAVASLEARGFKDGEAAPGLYGLETPEAKLTFRLAGKGEVVSLLVGRKRPGGKTTFVKAANALAVAIVDTDDLADLLAEPATYWAREIFKLHDQAKVTRLQLRRTDGTFTLARDANDTWALTAPLTGEADQDQVNKILDHIEGLSADRIVNLGADAPESFAKAEKIMQVVVTTERIPPQPETQPATQPTSLPTTGPATQPAPKPEPIVEKVTVTFAKVGLHSYAWVGKGAIVAVGQFAPGLYEDLAGDLRRKKVWQIEPDAIRKITFGAGADSLELTSKDGQEWKYATDAYVKIDGEKVDSFLDGIKELDAKKFLAHEIPADRTKYGQDKIWLMLELTDRDGARTTITVSHKGPTESEDRFATASTVPGVFAIDAAVIEKLGKKLEDFEAK